MEKGFDEHNLTVVFVGLTLREKGSREFGKLLAICHFLSNFSTVKLLHCTGLKLGFQMRLYIFLTFGNVPSSESFKYFTSGLFMFDILINFLKFETG